MPVESQNDFSAGMIRDEPPHLIPANGVFDADNFIFDQAGVARRRGGTTRVDSGAHTAVALSIGVARDSVLPNSGTLYASGSGGVYYLNSTTGLFTLITASGASGRMPVEHFGSLFFPRSSTRGVWVGGATGAKTDRTFAAAASVVITAGNPVVTTAAGDNTSTMEVGQYIEIYKNSSPFSLYIGKIKAILTASTILVDPTPTVTFTPTDASTRNSYEHSPAYSGVEYTAKHAVSFQNRVVLADTTYYDAANPVAAVEQHPKRLVWTDLPTEVPSSNNATHTFTGANWLRTDGISKNNFEDIAEIDTIQGLAAIGDDQLLIFGKTRAFKLTGELTTQSAAGSSFSWDIHPIPSSVGLLNERSMQNSPRGLIFCSRDGVFVYDGAVMRPIMQGRVLAFWRDFIKNSSTVPEDAVQGSALLGGSFYMLTLTSANRDTTTLFCNLDTLAWARSTSTQIKMFHSVIDPLDQTIVWGLRWWDTNGAAPSLTGGQAVRLDTILTPQAGASTDSDTTAFTSTLITRTFTAGEPGVVKKTRHARFAYSMTGTSTVTVTRTDALVTGATPLSLNSTGVATTLPSTSSARSVKGFGDYTQRAPGVFYTIAQTGTAPDALEIDAVQHSYTPARVTETV